MYCLPIVLPLITAIILGIKGRNIGEKGLEKLIKVVMVTTIIISINILKEIISNNIIIKINIFKWIEINDLLVNYTLEYNETSILMLNLVLIISTIVQLYSLWYMQEDPHKIRFLAYLLTFTVMMSILVLSNNLIFLFIGWEGIGVLSYLLINFWYTRIQANKSALKAMYYNRIGDICFLFGFIILLYDFKNNNYNTILLLNNDISLFNLSIFLFTIAAFTKSAQFLFHPWLASSMEGPTPVSALLHAATMVTAGVYLLIKLKILVYKSSILPFIIIYSIITIVFSGLSSLFQSDIKKIIAFSTSAQLGYMFLAIGLKEVNGLYHLLTHGFFKALLFLLAGILIHSLLDNQDLRKFGSKIFLLPLNYSFFLIATLAIISFPFLAGYYSKEIIIENSYISNIYIYILSLLGAILTIIYSVKMLYKVYYSNIKVNKINYMNIHDAPLNIYFILFVLVLGSIFSGYLLSDFFIGAGNNIDDAEFLPYYIKLIPTILMLILIPLVIYNINIILKKLTQFFSLHLFIDSFVNSFVKYLFNLGYSHFFKNFDRGLLESIPINVYRYTNFIAFEPVQNKYYSYNNYIIFMFIILFSISFLFYYF